MATCMAMYTKTATGLAAEAYEQATGGANNIPKPDVSLCVCAHIQAMHIRL